MYTQEKFKIGDIVQHFQDGQVMRVAGFPAPVSSDAKHGEFVECIPLDGNQEKDRLIFHESALVKVTDLLKPGMAELLSKIRNIPHPPRNVA